MILHGEMRDVFRFDHAAPVGRPKRARRARGFGAGVVAGAGQVHHAHVPELAGEFAAAGVNEIDQPLPRRERCASA